MKFTLTINLGNEAIRTAEEVAERLRDIARRVDSCTFDVPEGPYHIRDINGNRVGSWEVVE
jgi:hypothetical protein